MINKLDNRFSIDLEEFKNLEISSWFDLDQVFLVPGKIRIEHHQDILRSFFSNKEEYEMLFQCMADCLHNSIPQEIKDNCQFCQGHGDDSNSVHCKDYMNKAEQEFDVLSYVFVMTMINNEDVFHTKKHKRELAITFFEQLEYNSGKLEFRDTKLDRMMLDMSLELKKEQLEEFPSTDTAVEYLNDSLYYLRDYKFRAKLNGRLISDHLKPQVKFFKNELTHQLNKRTIKLKAKKVIVAPTIGVKRSDLASYFEYTSRYTCIINLLISKNKIEQGTNIWADCGNGHKGYCASMIKNLHTKGYFTNNDKPSTEEIRIMCKLTFGLDLSKSLVDRAKPDSHNFDFIPVASTLATNL